MSMIKWVQPGSYDFGESNAQLIKMAAAGLRGNDLSAFIKRAGHKMADAMRKLSFAPGEVPIHVIAIGATEYYGPNRNGDGFSEACCRKYHDTFVKHARWYRNHQNKDPQKSFGIIKYSDYNETMHRLEVIVALNSTKEAARRNNGLVADKEMQKLASGSDDWGVSMACKVAYDVCSGCGNRARTKEEYCTAETCSYGGCAENLCKVAEDGHIQYVDNPHPTWFDLSDVYRGADRIAFVLGPMQKAASGRVISSAELAARAGITAPFELQLTDITDRKIKEQLKIAGMLADMECRMNEYSITNSVAPLSQTFMQHFDEIPDSPREKAQALKALARQKIAMSFKDFVRFTSNCNQERAERIAAQVQPQLPALFSRMCWDVEKLAEDLARNPFRPSDTEPSAKWVRWAEKNASYAKLDLECLQKCAWVGAIREQNVTFIKAANAPSAAHEGLARAYGLYKLAFLYEIKDTDNDFALTSDLVVRQNHVS